MLFELKAFREQAIHAARTPHHVKYSVACQALEMMVVRPARRFKPSWAMRQIDTDQVTIVQALIQQPIDRCEANARVMKNRMHLRCGQGPRCGIKGVTNKLSVSRGASHLYI